MVVDSHIWNYHSTLVGRIFRLDTKVPPFRSKSSFYDKKIETFIAKRILFHRAWVKNWSSILSYRSTQVLYRNLPKNLFFRRGDRSDWDWPWKSGKIEKVYTLWLCSHLWLRSTSRSFVDCAHNMGRVGHYSGRSSSKGSNFSLKRGSNDSWK